VNPVAVRGIFAFILVAAIFTAGYFFGWRGPHDQLVKYKAQVEQANKDATAEKIAKIQEGSAQHDKDQALITFLRNESGSVRIHIPSHCPDPQSKTDSDGGARLFSDQIDAALAEVRESDRIDAFRCDQLNIDARQSNTANR